MAVDKVGRVLFIHVGSPYSTHDLINILKKLPLNIDRAMYVEGGPQAQLYIKIGTHEYEFVGSHKIEMENNMTSLFSRPIPNVVGISLKKDYVPQVMRELTPVLRTGFPPQVTGGTLQEICPLGQLVQAYWLTVSR